MKSGLGYGLLLLATLCFGCVADPGSGTDGSTHWVTCSVDTDCDSGKCERGHCGEPAAAMDTTPLKAEAGQVGEACIPANELRADFNGFRFHDVNVSANSACVTGVCLVNDFQGRTTCPNGQAEGETSCTVPGSAEPVSVPVQAGLAERPASDAVYCSCRCDGPDPDAEYCECGAGFECAALIADIGFAPEVTGSYCVAEGTHPYADLVSTNCSVEAGNCDATAYLSLDVEATEGSAEPASTQFRFEQFSAVGADCLSRPLPLLRDDSGFVGAACKMYEGRNTIERGCEGPTRRDVSDEITAVVRAQMRSLNDCRTDAECERIDVCEIDQLQRGEENYDECLTLPGIEANGWCYLAPELGEGQLQFQCSAEHPHSVRVLGEAGAAPGARIFLACLGDD